MSVQKDNEAPATTQHCVLCSNPITNAVFSPFCSMKCARSGTSRRYNLLLTFLDFETKYILPPQKEEAAKSSSKQEKSSEDISIKEPEKPKRLPRLSYTQYVPAMRQKSRTLLKSALEIPFTTSSEEQEATQSDTSDMACRIEQALYNLYPFSQKFELKSDYSSRLRVLLFNLRDVKNPDLRRRLHMDIIEPERLPLMSTDELASDEMRKLREEEARKHLEENVLLAADSEMIVGGISNMVSSSMTTESEITTSTSTSPAGMGEEKKERGIEGEEEGKKSIGASDSQDLVSNSLTRTNSELSTDGLLSEEARAERAKEIAAMLEGIPLSLPSTNLNEDNTNNSSSHSPNSVDNGMETELTTPSQQTSNDLTQTALQGLSSIAGGNIDNASTLDKEANEEKNEGMEVEDSVPVELSLREGSESRLSIAMPEGDPIQFSMRVIEAPRDLEEEKLEVLPVVPIIGRMAVKTCQEFYDSRQHDPGYDVVWALLELAEESTE